MGKGCGRLEELLQEDKECKGSRQKVANPQICTINFIKLFKGWQPFS